MHVSMEDLIEYLIGPLAGDQDARRLADMLEGLDNERRAVAAGMPVEGDMAVDASLLDELARADGPIGDIATIALARRGDAGAVARLDELIHSRDDAIRNAAILSLGGTGGISSTERLILLAENTSEPEGSRINTIRALASIREPRAASALQSLLQDVSKSVRVAAVRALGELGAVEGAPDPVQSLCKALRDEAREVRVCAIDALGTLADRRCVEPLAQALADQHSEVRKRAALALAELGDTRGANVLAQTLADRSVSDRIGVLRSLARMGGQEAIDALIGVLGEPGTEIPAEAARALGDLGGTRAVEPLKNLLGNGQHPVVREAAEEALLALGTTIGPPARPKRPEDSVPPSQYGIRPKPRKSAIAPGTDLVMRTIDGFECDYEPVGNGWELIVTSASGRRRRVRILLGDGDAFGRPVIRLKADICLANPKKLRAALAHNADLDCGVIAIENVRRNDRLVLLAAVPVEIADTELLRKAIRMAATTATQLADELM